MASRSLDNRGDHDARVRRAEVDSTVVDKMKYDFKAFQSALASLEGYLQDFWRILNLDAAIKESISTLLMEQRVRSEVTSLLLDNLVSRYDRFLNLVLYLHASSS